FHKIGLDPHLHLFAATGRGPSRFLFGYHFLFSLLPSTSSLFSLILTSRRSSYTSIHATKLAMLATVAAVMTQKHMLSAGTVATFQRNIPPKTKLDANTKGG